MSVLNQRVRTLLHVSDTDGASLAHIQTFGQTDSASAGASMVLPGGVDLPFVLAYAIPPIPPKIVKKIKEGCYVDMKDLLPDNVALLEKLESLPGQAFAAAASTPGRPRLREVASIQAWLSCLLKMIAVQSTVNPSKVADMCAYGVLVIREAAKHGGNGWSAYDTLFRKHAAARPDTSWANLDPSIHASTFLACRTGASTLCLYCSGADHLTKDCALASLQASGPQANQLGGPRCDLPKLLPQAKRICNSWNRGKCAYGTACSYRHICATCQENPPHQAKDCRLTPADSIFRRPYSNSGTAK